ncbi:MAG: response regulator [Anaerolineae bacterium]|jgi:DNA-binding response OmpR family regulator/predicted regulator of Ras-like GTPase activity (Roadblock/LC7/MglB family)|nr:response regulator [Anaerolineae bacterium]
MHILVVDPNVAFATLLHEELQRHGHDVVGASSFNEALKLAGAGNLDLALLDMAVDGAGAVVLGQKLREMHPTLRLVLIPLMGETLAPEVASSLAIQGILPKPFFLPELEERIEAALRAPLLPLGVSITDTLPPEPAAKPAPVAAPQPAPAVEAEKKVVNEAAVKLKSLVSKHRKAVERAMSSLAQEVGADAVVLTVDDEMATWVGMLAKSDADVMAQAVIQGWITSAKVARILGREQLRFEQSIAGGDYMLYALSVNTLMILAVAIRGGPALGLLRHRAREAAEEIADLCAV